MRDLNYQLKTIWRRNVDGSHATHYNRLDMLQLMANQLHDLGFRHLTARGLKAKHVQALVTHWQSQKITTGTIKNRMAILRWWAEKIGKPGVVAKSNAHYGIEQRQIFSTHSKAQTLLASKLQIPLFVSPSNSNRRLAYAAKKRSNSIPTMLIKTID